MAESAGTILVVDDQEQNLAVMRRLLAREGHRVLTAANGPEALDVVRRETPDIVLLDVVMPGLNGFEVCARLKADTATRLTPVVLVTGLQGREERLRGIEAGADDFLSKPVESAELSARVRSLIRLKRYTEDLESAESLAIGLAATVEARDPYTRGHCARLADYATRIGHHLGLNAEQLRALKQGGYLHDIGKIGVPDAILLKPGPLTREEFGVLKQHPVIGEELCGGFRSFRHVRPIVRNHHERLDGSGYPDGLRGDDVPLLAQIVAVVDVYDALTTARPYKGALSREDAFVTLLHEVQRGMHSALLVEMLELVTREPAAVEAGRPLDLDRLH